MDPHGPQLVTEPGLEVVVPDEHNYAYAISQQPGEGDKLASPPTATTPPKPRKRLWWALGGAVLVVAIVGAVVGGVLGSRAAASSSSSSSSSSSPSPTSTSSSAPLQSIRRNSALAVTGYRGNGDFKLHLFYQGPDNVLRTSAFSSVADSWAPPVKLDGLAPMAKTPLAAGTWLKVSPVSLLPNFSTIKTYMRKSRLVEGQGGGDYRLSTLSTDKSVLFNPPHSREYTFTMLTKPQCCVDRCSGKALHLRQDRLAK